MCGRRAVENVKWWGMEGILLNKLLILFIV